MKISISSLLPFVILYEMYKWKGQNYDVQF